MQLKMVKFEMSNCGHVQGPLMSNVFGQILLINVVPSKICPGDCIYCPEGRTTHQTIDRECFYSVDKIIFELMDKLESDGTVDHIVITGCGDPTLYSDLKHMIKEIKKRCSIPVVVNSCGTLLWRKDVQSDLLYSDIVLVSVDAPNKELYHSVNKMFVLVPYLRFINGILEFTTIYKGKLFIKTCLLDGINTDEITVKNLSVLLGKIEPLKILFQTAQAQSVKHDSYTLTNEQLHALSTKFGSRVTVLDKNLLGSFSERRKQCYR